MKINHTLENISVNYSSRAASRNRVRIPVLGVLATAIFAGERVLVRRVGKKVEVTVNPTGNYKVEKDGAVRFPAHSFGLKSDSVKIKADALRRTVFLS